MGWNQSMEALGRRVLFTDGKRRIDFILAWRDEKNDDADEDEKEKQFERKQAREIFEGNLEDEGLELEHDIQEDRKIQFTKVHAPWEVLTRYAEIMKIRMPIKDIPDELELDSLWDMMKNYITRMISPFELDPEKVPRLPKKFTHVFQRDKEYLFAIPIRNEYFFSHATRNRIVDYILRRKRFTYNEAEPYDFGISRLLSLGTYTASYPLHEGSWKPWTKPSMRRLLYENWSHWKNFFKVQPMDYIRVYFGEKISLYFSWLGYYTWMLILPSVVGVVVFLYGVATINKNVLAQEGCDTNLNLTMCPLCDVRCPYWEYSSVCTDLRASHMFDNGATVFFACFMSLWGTVFLELWKREQHSLQYKWNLLNFEEEEEPPRPEYVTEMMNSKYSKKHKVSGLEEPFIPFWRRKLPVYLGSAVSVVFMCLVALGFVFGIIAYRMTVRAAIYLGDNVTLYKAAGIITSTTAACLNLIIIFVLNKVYSKAAVTLTDLECHRTQSQYDNALNLKLYVLKFVNYYSSIFYIAFFKGRFSGRPGDYNTLFGARQEECQGSCLMELCIQLSITFVGKQLIKDNIMDIFIPKLKKALNKGCHQPAPKTEEKKKLSPWEKDYELSTLGPRGLYEEYLDMMLQFGFVTLFVAAFPLAPLFAFLNNTIELRADAIKFTTRYRRPPAHVAQDIGVWYSILYYIARISVITNAFIIAVTSSFIHRLVYKYNYSEDNTYSGYTENSMAYFNISDFAPGTAFNDTQGRFKHVQYCRYQAYREPFWVENKYEYTTQHWHTLAIQLAFVFLFENIILVLTSLIAQVIPDMPRHLGDRQRREKHLVHELIVENELRIAHGDDIGLGEDELRRIRLRAQMGLSQQNLDGGRMRSRRSSATQYSQYGMMGRDDGGEGGILRSRTNSATQISHYGVNRGEDSEGGILRSRTNSATQISRYGIGQNRDGDEVEGILRTRTNSAVLCPHNNGVSPRGEESEGGILRTRTSSATQYSNVGVGDDEVSVRTKSCMVHHSQKDGSGDSDSSGRKPRSSLSPNYSRA